jgi:hypothetical protein
MRGGSAGPEREPRPRKLRRATEAGTDDILDKLTPSEEVVEAIRRLGTGGTPDRQEE